MATKNYFSVLLSVSLGLPFTAATATTAAELTSGASERCNALARADLSDVPDVLLQVLGTKSVDASADTASYCQVSGYVASHVGFLLRLPLSNWNGKFLEIGCGGACGSTEHIFLCDDPVRRGYACIVSDGGHKSTPQDSKWAYDNLQAKLDSAYRAHHVTALAGKAIVDRYYNQAPKQSYFMGCSSGGKSALWEAQKFPWDFDGIVAGAPALDSPAVNWLWNNRALTDKNGNASLAQADLDILHRAVIRTCGRDDGVDDGLVSDPRACTLDPSELLCRKEGETRCLTAKKIDAIKKIYQGPVTSKGEQIFMSSAMKGSELLWLESFSGSADMRKLMTDSLRYSAFEPSPGPTWTIEKFDFDRDYKRLQSWAPLNPDLRKFRAKGGKLLSYTGWNDVFEVPLRTADYYESVERVLGGRVATQEFFRLFAIPGMTHCTGGDGAFAVDYLSYLDAWVEKGLPPEKLIGSHVRLEHPDDAWSLKFPLDPARVEFSRPIYPYPVQARYLGHGDPNDAASFGPAEQ